MVKKSLAEKIAKKSFKSAKFQKFVDKKGDIYYNLLCIVVCKIRLFGDLEEF